MYTIRKIGVTLALSVLPVALFIFGLLWSMHHLFGSPERVKQVVASSGIYDNFVSDLLSLKDDPTATGNDEIPLDQPDVREIVENAATPAFLQDQTERFIDGFYAWLHDKQTAPIIDLTEPKTKLVDGLTTHAANRIASLPVCTAPPAGEFDPLSAECVPPGIDRQAAVDQIRNHINEQFKDPVIRPDTSQTSEIGAYQVDWQRVPDGYQRFVRSVWISGVLALVLAVAAIWLSPRLFIGLRRVGVIFMTVGGVSALAAFIGNGIVHVFAENGIETGGPQGFIQLATTTVDTFSSYWLLFGLAILILGVAMIIAAIVLRKRNGDDTTSAERSDVATSLASNNPETKEKATDSSRPISDGHSSKTKLPRS